MAEVARGATANLCVIGPQPPPRHGVSAMNEVVVDVSRAHGIAVTVLDTAPVSLERALTARLGRISKIYSALAGVGRYVRQHSRGAVYISLSGGLGLIWEALFAWRARTGRVQLVVHHHSFRYIDRAYWPLNLLVRTAGPEALHVVLCSRMDEMLRHRYPGIRRTLIMSNAALLKPAVPLRSASTRFRTIGFLANISPAKGMLEVINLARIALRESEEIRFKIAGPFESERFEAQFKEMVQGLPNLEYVGPVYGESKEIFFENIDAFIFPTRYRNEAEPLVILEALRYGRPSIAFARGCIGSLLEAGAGIAVPIEADFASFALPEILRWRRESQAFASACDNAFRRYMSLQQAAADARTAFICELKSTRG